LLCGIRRGSIWLLARRQQSSGSLGLFVWLSALNWRGGELVEIKIGFLTVGEKYFRFLHQMYNDETGGMVATCDCVAVPQALDFPAAAKRE
jgi:hypothetical protein